jgi:dTDP-4-dehydro-6-deoxy-alpha-D-glucopyranose 2,3-dehydratase
MDDLGPSPTAVSALLRSALVTDSRLMPLDQFAAWRTEQGLHQHLHIERVRFQDLDEWNFLKDPYRLAHRSGRFFEIEGIRVETDFLSPRAWEQPIIRQPEIGNLGCIAREFEGVLHFLMQAKSEPGNISGIQLSPTEQATRSNYLKVHGGHLPAYHEYFTGTGMATVLVDRLLSEHGTRFLQKRNRNVIVQVDDDVPMREGFCWLTLGQIKRLTLQDDVVNMTTRSVLSSIFTPLGPGLLNLTLLDLSEFGRDVLKSLEASSNGVHRMGDVLSWLSALRAKYTIRVHRRSVDDLEGWAFGEDEIVAEDAEHGFSVIAVAVEATGREVRSWTQPIIHHSALGLNGFLLKPINGVLHFLVRARLPPGGDTSLELGPTTCNVSRDALCAEVNRHPYLAPFYDPHPRLTHHRSVQSEEGGRFNHFRNEYLIIHVPDDCVVEESEDTRWLTLGQLATFSHFGMVSIEARNLLACLDLSSPSTGAPPLSPPETIRLDAAARVATV